MVARTRPDRGGLIVVFSRDREEQEELAVDSHQAAARSITAMATHLRFLPGDIMIGRRADDSLTCNPGVLGNLPEF